MVKIMNALFDDPCVEQSPTQKRADMSSFLLAMLFAFGSSFFFRAPGGLITGVFVYAGLRFLQRGGY